MAEINEKIKVYVMLDDDGNIINVNSSIFLSDLAGWVEIDEGNGDRYAYARHDYFADGYRDEWGRPLYKWDGEQVTANPPWPPPEPPKEPPLSQAEINDFMYGLMGVQV